MARNAVFAMGLVGSGTNNARLAGMLRNLAQFYHKEPQDLFMVRLAQVSQIILPSLSDTVEILLVNFTRMTYFKKNLPISELEVQIEPLKSVWSQNVEVPHSYRD